MGFSAETDSGGYGGTNWNGYDVRYMWKMVESQQTDSHWKQVAGWRKTFELTSMHLWRLKEYREKLAAAWPPEKSPASQAYMARLDYLIGHVQATYDAAVANYDAFAGATGALSTTRHQLKQLHDEYNANQTKLDDYDQQVAAARDPANSGLPQPMLGPPPVAPGRQEELNRQARVLMFGLSSELTQARAAIRQPPPYESGRTRSPGETYSGGPDGFAGTTPPVIPPVVPVPAIPTPPGPTAPGAGTLTPSSGVGPILGGTGPVTTLPPPGTINPITPNPLPPGGPPSTGIIGPIVPPPAMPGPKPGTGLIGPNPIPPKPPGLGNAAGVPPKLPSILPKPLPPGGMIGTPTAMPFGPTVGGQPLTGHRANPVAGGSRVNPVGGVIGQRPGAGAGPGIGMTPGSTPGGRLGATGAGVAPGAMPNRPVAAGPRTNAGGSGQPFGAIPARGGRGEHEEEHGRHWDPDNPWETDEGVAPVVLPPQVSRVDPGPAIGSDR